MRLHLVRHGQTPSNVGRHLDTAEPGPGLTELGRRQALALPESLGTAGIQTIYASTLVRTQLTAEPLSRALGQQVLIRRGLREIPAGSLEMANDQESIRDYLSVVLGWAGGELGLSIPGTSLDGHAVLGAFDEVVEEVVRSGVTTAALFSHGAVIRAWAASRSRNITADFAAEHPVLNTGAVLVTGEPGRWYTERWQEHALGGPAVERAAEALTGARTEAGATAATVDPETVPGD